MAESKELTIFISYAQEDIDYAKKMYEDLKRKGMSPWFAPESILPGQNWEITIETAIEKCRYFLALLSSNSVKKMGVVNKEITQALKKLDKFPENQIYIIPARLDNCEPSHEKLKDLHFVDMFPKWDEGLEKIHIGIMEDCFSGKCEADENVLKDLVGSYLRDVYEWTVDYVDDDYVKECTDICKRDKKFYKIEKLRPMLHKSFKDAKIDEKTKTSKRMDKKIRKILEYPNAEEGLVAVIVGIDGYKDMRPLHCAVNDAVCLKETLKKLWRDRKVHIEPLIWPSFDKVQAKSQKETLEIELPKDANIITRENILSVVQEYAGLAGESDTFIFYFSGHGALLDEEPALITVGDGNTAKGVERIKISEIQKAADGSLSAKKVMIIDCFQISTDKDKIVNGYKNLINLMGEWSILLSCSPGEISLEDQCLGDSRDDNLQRGIFTNKLVEGLRGEACGRDGSVSLAELANFVEKRVPMEYQKCIETFFPDRGEHVKEGDQLKINNRRTSSSQNPVLLSNIIASNGPYKITMAPEYLPTSLRARQKFPGKIFFKNWFEFLFGRWPTEFPSRLRFRLGAFWYAATMMLTVLWHSQNTATETPLIFLGIVGFGSVLLWWLTLPFAVAANENRWYRGGYLTFISYLLWHCIVAISFACLCSIDQNIRPIADGSFYLALDLFFILAVVLIFGCNASQTVIAIAEKIRQGEMDEILKTIQEFGQIKSKLLKMGFYSFVPNILFNPAFYFYILGISIPIIIINTYQILVNSGAAIFLMRNIFALILVAWLVFWYQAAFISIQKKVS